ncbi:HEPN domain-containing protein [Halochromatium sp.]
MTERCLALFGKARALEASQRALDQSDRETASDRAYYAVYYAAWGLLDLVGAPRPKTHNGLIAEFSRRYVKEKHVGVEIGAILSRLQQLRLVADYTLEPIPLDDAKRVRLLRQSDSSPSLKRSRQLRDLDLDDAQRPMLLSRDLRATPAQSRRP